MRRGGAKPRRAARKEPSARTPRARGLGPRAPRAKRRTPKTRAKAPAFARAQMRNGPVGGAGPLRESGSVEGVANVPEAPCGESLATRS